MYGTNCASVLNSLTIGFKKINIPVKSLSFDFNRSVYNNYSEIECICTDNNPGTIKQYFYKIKGLIILIRYLLWCDIVHVYGTKRKIHYWLIAKLAKYRFVTFVGADIRMPEIELTLNPYYKYAYYDEGYERKHESNNDSNEIVRCLAKLDYGIIVWDAETFIDRKITSKVGIVPHASANKTQNNLIKNLSAEKKVIIIHSPTASIAKGTKFVLKAIEKLKEKNIPFEFRLLKDLPNEEYQQLLMEADIYIDQLIWGAYGVAAQQALEMGKVVVAYIAPARLKLFQEINNLPVQNATIDNLTEVLEFLITNREMREEISRQSILYYKKMHQPENVATKMFATYKSLSSS